MFPCFSIKLHVVAGLLHVLFPCAALTLTIMRPLQGQPLALVASAPAGCLYKLNSCNEVKGASIPHHSTIPLSIHAAVALHFTGKDPSIRFLYNEATY